MKEFYFLAKPLPSTKPIKIKPTTPKPEILSIFNNPPPPPLAVYEPKQEAAQSVEPLASILKVEVPSSTTTQEADNSKSVTYSIENEIKTDDDQVEVPPSEKDVKLLFAKEQEISTIFSTEQELEEVLAFFPTEQEEVPPSPPPSSPPIEQEEVPPFFSTEQEEVLPPDTSEQVQIVNKEEEEEIITSEDETAPNSPYQVRYAKKPTPNYQQKVNDESEISDYESEEDDLGITDDNNNQDGYSSQAASIFFDGVEAEPTPRLNILPKDDDEV